MTRKYYRGRGTSDHVAGLYSCDIPGPAALKKVNAIEERKVWCGKYFMALIGLLLIAEGVASLVENKELNESLL